MHHKLTTLLIGSLSSAATAVVLHEVWRAGAIAGAAVTPILVAVFGELLRAPVRGAQTLAGPRAVRSAAGVRVYRTPPRWGAAAATALTAFAIGLAGLTAVELALDRSVGGRAEHTTVLDAGRATPAPPPAAAAGGGASPAPRGGGDPAPRERSERRARDERSEPRRRRSAPRPADRATGTAVGASPAVVLGTGERDAAAPARTAPEPPVAPATAPPADVEPAEPETARGGGSPPQR